MNNVKKDINIDFTDYECQYGLNFKNKVLYDDIGNKFDC